MAQYMLLDMNERAPNLTRTWVEAKKSMARLLLGQALPAASWAKYGYDEATWVKANGGKPIVWADHKQRRQQELGKLGLKLAKAIVSVSRAAQELDQALDEYESDFGGQHAKR